MRRRLILDAGSALATRAENKVHTRILRMPLLDFDSTHLVTVFGHTMFDNITSRSLITGPNR
eukprot:COSAG01_NODE_9585_length_2400_cov_2.812690_2_plen_62_part_00